MPLRIVPRPVNALRAAPTPKWDSIARANEVQIAPGPVLKRNGATGNERAERRGRTGDPRLPHRCAARLADAQLLPHLLLQRALRVVHDLRRQRRGLRLGHALGLIEQAQLLPLELGHEPDLLPLQRDLVLEHLPLALGGEIARRAHGQRVRHHPGQPATSTACSAEARLPCAPIIPATRPKFAVSPSLNP